MFTNFQKLHAGSDHTHMLSVCKFRIQSQADRMRSWWWLLEQCWIWRNAKDSSRTTLYLESAAISLAHKHFHSHGFDWSHLWLRRLCNGWSPISPEQQSIKAAQARTFFSVCFFYSIHILIPTGVLSAFFLTFPISNPVMDTKSAGRWKGLHRLRH